MKIDEWIATYCLRYGFDQIRTADLADGEAMLLMIAARDIEYDGGDTNDEETRAEKESNPTKYKWRRLGRTIGRAAYAKGLCEREPGTNVYGKMNGTKFPS